MNITFLNMTAPLGRSLLAAMALACSLTATATTPGFYFDGNVKRPITLDPGLVADIVPTPIAGSPQARGASRSPAPLVALRTVTGNVSKSAIGGLTSPVYREGNSPAGRPMALPGGVLVKLQPAWTEEQVRAWVTAKGLVISQRLNITGNWYVLATAPGNASLELANQLHQSGEVLSATPNWWKQTVAR